MNLSDTEFRLLNDTQRGFPLESRPFAQLGRQMDLSEADVLARLARLQGAGAVSRLGAVVAPNTLGASTLAAMRVPKGRLAEIASVVSAKSEVNHNYEREHAVNLWFVVTASDHAHLTAVVRDLENETALPVLDLRLEVAYHIDLGFDLRQGTRPRESGPITASGARKNGAGSLVDSRDRRLLAAIEEGLPLVPQPYAEVARLSGMSEAEVLSRLSKLIELGVIKRFGVVVRHHELGYRDNAMAVWDVPDETVDDLGRELAKEPGVTLCYRRTRRPPIWPFNLYCMIHGRDRDTVMEQIARINDARLGMARSHAVLFSCRRFKQRGARYLAVSAARGGGGS